MERATVQQIGDNPDKKYAIPFSAPYMNVRTAWAVDPRFDPKCAIMQDTTRCNTLKKHLKEIMKQKKLVMNESTTTAFYLGASTGSTGDFLNRMIVSTWGAELKTDTGLDLIAIHNAQDKITIGDVGTGNTTLVFIHNHAKLGRNETEKLLVDSFASDDWYVRQVSNFSIQISDTDTLAYPFLGSSDPYGMILPINKKIDKLQTAVKLALSCLKHAEMYDIQSVQDFLAAPVLVRSAISKRFGSEFGNGADICTKIVLTVGSLKTLKDLAFNSNDIKIQGCKVDTSQVYALTL